MANVLYGLHADVDQQVLLAMAVKSVAAMRARSPK